jgi:hypothetical protein
MWDENWEGEKDQAFMLMVREARQQAQTAHKHLM